MKLDLKSLFKILQYILDLIESYSNLTIDRILDSISMSRILTIARSTMTNQRMTQRNFVDGWVAKKNNIVAVQRVFQDPDKGHLHVRHLYFNFLI